MNREEAIRILDMKTSAKALAEIEYYNGFSGREAVLKAVDDACVLAVAALREQEERESVWHNAKDSPPKKPGLYYGKKDDTDSMFLCQYRDGVWTMDAYPETRMHVIKWAYYNAFVQDQEQWRWIPVTERLPDSDGFYIVVMNGDIWGEPDVWSSTACGFYNGKWDEDYATISHWMPMPKPPMEG